MNLSDELKEKVLLMLLEGESVKAPASPFIGKVVMVRTYSAGVHFGTLVSKHKQNVVLKDSRRVWYWACACSLSQLAMDGDQKLDSCKIAMSVNNIELDQAIEVIPMTEKAADLMLNAPVWKK